MADNLAQYGFRWVRGINGESACPAPERVPVASAYQGAINGGTNVAINVGDVVKRLSTGYVAIAEGTEIATYPTAKADIPYGVVVGIKPYFDGDVMRPGTSLPGATTYGTNYERQSFLLVVPAQAGVWSVDMDASHANYDTYAEILALIGERVDMVNSNDITNKANPQISIAGHATTVTHRWTLFGIDPTQNNRDYSGENVKLLLTANSYTDAPNTIGT